MKNRGSVGRYLFSLMLFQYLYFVEPLLLFVKDITCTDLLFFQTQVPVNPLPDMPNLGISQLSSR